LFEDDDEDITSSSRKSNLRNLFGATTTTTSKDSSLTYQRPKAPTKSEPATAKTTSKSNLPALLYTTRVDLYKAGTNPPEYVQIGAAIVENASGPSKFNLILYYTREKVIALVPITRDFVLTLQLQDGTSFGSFYDTKQTLWSFRFLKSDDMDQLAIHVTIAKHYEEPGQILTQEMAAATKGTGALKDDILGVRYVSYSEKLGKLSDPIDDNTNKPQPTKYVVGGVNKTGFPGWEVGLDGMKRGGRRVLLVPGEGDGSVMVYKLHVEKMKKATSAPESAPSSGKLPQASDHHDAAVVTNAADSTPEPGSPVGENSNAILQRMSKMAVATPFAGGGMKSSLAPTDTEVPATAAPVVAEAPQTQTFAPAPAAASPQQAPQPQMMQPQMNMPAQGQQPMGYPMQGQYGQNMGTNSFGMSGPMGAASGYGNNGYGSNYGPNAYGMGGAPGGAGSMYGGNNSLSLYNPQQQQMMWGVQQGGMGPWASGVPMGPAQAAATPVKETSSSETSSAKESSSKDVLSQADAIQLLIDGRQFQSEIKSSLTKMSTQLEDVEERLEGTMFTKNKDLGGGVTAKVLLQTIARIVGENERMLEELATRDERIDHLTLKLNKLHETNQRVIDENNRFMEERSSTFKTATDSQLRQLETFREEKTALEMELTSSNRQFQTLKRSFTNVSTELETLKEEMERLKADRDIAVSKYAGVAGASQSAESRLIEETSARRKLELDVQQLRDELTTERETVDTLRRDTEDRKTRYAREAANLEQHHIAEKSAYEEQIAKLQEALRKERATLGASADQAASEIESKWNARYQTDLQRAQSTLAADWEAKFEQHRASIEGEARERIKVLRETLAQESAATVTEFETERTTWREKEQAFRRHISQLQEVALSSAEAQEVIQRLRAEMAEAAATNVSSIKSIMNQVYVSLNELFEDGENVQYDKSGIMDTLKGMIISTTKRVVNPDDEVSPVEKPVPVAPIRVEVPVEVRVEVPTHVAPTASSAPSASSEAHPEPKETVEHFMELSHPEEPALTRIDSDSHITVDTPANPLSDDHSDDVENPLAPKAEEDEEEAPKPVVPVDDGWEALNRHEPDFVQPVEPEPEVSKDEPEEIDPLSAPKEDEEIDPLSAPVADDDDVVVESPLLAPSEPEEAPHTVDENPLGSQVEEDENPLSVSQSEPQATETTEEIVSESVETKEPEVESPLEETVESDADVVPNGSETAPAPIPEVETPVVASVAPVEEDDDPFGVGEAVAPNKSEPVVVASPAAAEDDDDPFGVNESEKKPEVVSEAPKAAEPVDDDPFGVNEESSETTAPAATDAAVEESASTTTSTAVERPASPPNFFLDAEPKSNGSTPAKKGTSFFDDEDDATTTPTTKAAAVPSTEPKKKSTSFFDDDDDPVPPAKAPSSASKAFSFGDDDDTFGTSKPKSKKSDALDDIFGGISSSGSTAKKGLFDD